MKQKRLPKTPIGVALLAPLLMLLPACQSGNPAVVQQSGTASMHEASVQQTSLSYLAHSPATVAEMQALLGSAPTSTHTDPAGEYSHWESYELDRRGGEYVTNAGCLSKDGKVISSFFQYREPFVKRRNSHTITYGDTALPRHVGMLEAMRKSQSLRGVTQQAPSQPVSAPAASGADNQALAANTQAAPAQPEASAPVNYAPAQQPQQQQQQSTGSQLLRTVNNVMEIIQLFQ